MTARDAYFTILGYLENYQVASERTLLGLGLTQVQIDTALSQLRLDGRVSRTGKREPWRLVRRQEP